MRSKYTTFAPPRKFGERVSSRDTRPTIVGRDWLPIAGSMMLYSPRLGRFKFSGSRENAIVAASALASKARSPGTAPKCAGAACN
jgi:hypothetical protein